MKKKGRQRIELKKNQEARVLKIFAGNKKTKGIKDARVIAKEVGVPVHAVMRKLEDLGLKRYSPGSYAPSKPGPYSPWKP